MREVFLGEYIKHERLKQGITQEQLCEGICDPVTVSRMESGKQTPSRSRICAFLQRLGLPDERYFAPLSEDELEIKTLQDEIRAGRIQFERAAPEDRPRIRASCLQKLEELDKLAGPDEPVIRQHVLSERITLGKEDGPYGPKERLELLTKALCITVPNLDLEQIDLGLYSTEETTLLDKIADACMETGQQKKAVDIYRQLFQYAQRHYAKGMSRYAGKLALIARNYARVLFSLERYEHALEIARLGRKACVEYPYYQYLPGILELMGGCYFCLGDLDSCKECYCEAYCLYKVSGNDRDRLRLEEAAKKRLGLEFPFVAARRA